MPMYFVQHGVSVAKEIDPDRALSRDGRMDVERVAAHLHRTGVEVKRVYHSGKTRARQTAELLADQIGLGGVYELSGMKPNDDVVEFAASLEDGCMYAGHLPHLAKLVSFLVAGEEEVNVVQFTNGGVVCVDKDDSGYYVEWFLVPSICGD